MAGVTHRRPASTTRSKIAAGLAVVAMVAGACGGGDGDGAGGTREASLADVDFASAVAKAEDGRFRVVMKHRGPDGVERESVFAQDPPRQAMIHPDGRMIWDGEHSIICTERPGTAPECMSMGDFEVGLAQFGFEATFGTLMFAHRTIVASADVFAGFESERTEVAGRPAVCVTLDEVPLADFPLGGHSRICADVETGIIVLMESLGPGGSGERWEAAEVGEPRPEDFEPPVTPTELTVPTMPDVEITIPDGPDAPDITIPDFG